MSRFTHTACPNCAHCTGTAAGRAGRAAGRATAALATGGLSIAAGAFRRKCKGCEHPMSAHHSAAPRAAASATVQVVVNNGPAGPVDAIPGPPAMYPAPAPSLDPAAVAHLCQTPTCPNLPDPTGRDPERCTRCQSRLTRLAYTASSQAADPDGYKADMLARRRARYGHRRSA